LLQLFLVFILYVGLLLWRWQLQFDICPLKSMMMMMMTRNWRPDSARFKG